MIVVVVTMKLAACFISPQVVEFTYHAVQHDLEGHPVRASALLFFGEVLKSGSSQEGVELLAAVWIHATLISPALSR
jgi:hypothetical protein